LWRGSLCRSVPWQASTCCVASCTHVCGLLTRVCALPAQAPWAAPQQRP
jgi:hypothetical protein